MLTAFVFLLTTIFSCSESVTVADVLSEKRLVTLILFNDHNIIELLIARTEIDGLHTISLSIL